MLYIPFRIVDDLQRLNRRNFKLFSVAFAYQREKYSYNVEPNFLKELPPDPKDDDFEDLNVNENADIEGLWELLAQQLPNRTTAVRLKDPNKLGKRNLNRVYDQTPYVSRYPNLPNDHQR